MERRLYRSSRDKMLGGVCGGLAEYFAVDPVIVRIIAVLLALLNGLGIIAYIVLWIIVPRQEKVGSPTSEVIRDNLNNMGQEARRVGQEVRAAFGRPEERAVPPVVPPGEEETRPAARGGLWGTYVLAALLIVVGLLLLLHNFNLFWWLSFGRLWPLVLVLVGLLLLLRRSPR